jgi:hypothetical protein
MAGWQINEPKCEHRDKWIKIHIIAPGAIELGIIIWCGECFQATLTGTEEFIQSWTRKDGTFMLSDDAAREIRQASLDGKFSLKIERPRCWHKVDKV